MDAESAAAGPGRLKSERIQGPNGTSGGEDDPLEAMQVLLSSLARDLRQGIPAIRHLQAQIESESSPPSSHSSWAELLDPLIHDHLVAAIADLEAAAQASPANPAPAATDLHALWLEVDPVAAAALGREEKAP